MAEGGTEQDRVEEPILTASDKQHLFLKLFPARHRSAKLGIQLGLPDSVVQALLVDHDHHGQCLEEVVGEVLRRRPELSWKDVIAALRSPSVGLSDLANKLEVGQQTTRQPPPGSSTEVRCLTPEDAPIVMERLLPVQHKSYVLGLALGLPAHVVESIHVAYTTPRDRLLHIITSFLRGMQPTWKTIVDALLSKSVSELVLAHKIEAYCILPVSQFTVHDSTAEMEVVSSNELDTPKKEVDEVGVEGVRGRIRQLEEKFYVLKNRVRACLIERNDSVVDVADCLTSLSPDSDDHAVVFIKRHILDLFGAHDINKLFGTMNFHWNYLNPDLLYHLVDELRLDDLKQPKEVYNSDLTWFRKNTPLNLYCRTQERMRIAIGFREIVAEFDWPVSMMLEDVEQFRQAYASHYSLHVFAMMLFQVHLG